MKPEALLGLTGRDRQKGDLLSRATHELRTPLTSICALSEMMAEALREQGSHIALRHDPGQGA